MVREEDYKRAILSKYHADRNSLLREILQPSPAKLKRWSIYLLDTITADDLKSYGRFYGLKEVTAKGIQGFENDKLRPLTNFLTGKSELSDPLGLELLAVLVDLENRPFSKFRNHVGVEMMRNTTMQQDDVAIKSRCNPKEPIVVQENSMNPKSDAEVESKEGDSRLLGFFGGASTQGSKDHPDYGHNHDSVKASSTLSPEQREKNKRGALFFMLVIFALFVFGTYMVWYNFFNGGGSCMIWVNDHYETVPCDTQVNAFAGKKIIPLDEDRLKYQRKIAVCDTTTFFNPDGTAKVFYCKTNNQTVEYFSYPGRHPESGKPLKDITVYMINRWVKMEDAQH